MRGEAQPFPLDEDAAIAHDEQSRGAGARLRGRVADAQLRPHRAGADGDGLVHHGGQKDGAAKHVHDVNRFRQARQVG